MRYTFGLAIAGFISGILSLYSSILLKLIVPESMSDIWTSSILPGTIFGASIILGMFVFKLKKLIFFRCILWILGSTLSYFSAYSITLYLLTPISEFISNSTMVSARNNFDASLLYALLFGGLIGGFLVSVFFHLLLVPLRLKHSIVLSLLGCVLSVSLFIMPEGPSFNLSILGELQGNFLGLFIIWQTGMAAALGWVMDKSKLPSRK